MTNDQRSVTNWICSLRSFAPRNRPFSSPVMKFPFSLADSAAVPEPGVGGLLIGARRIFSPAAMRFFGVPGHWPHHRTLGMILQLQRAMRNLSRPAVGPVCVPIPSFIRPPVKVLIELRPDTNGRCAEHNRQHQSSPVSERNELRNEVSNQDGSNKPCGIVDPNEQTGRPQRGGIEDHCRNDDPGNTPSVGRNASAIDQFSPCRFAPAQGWRFGGSRSTHSMPIESIALAARSISGAQRGVWQCFRANWAIPSSRNPLEEPFNSGLIRLGRQDLPNWVLTFPFVCSVDCEYLL